MPLAALFDPATSDSGVELEHVASLGLTPERNGDPQDERPCKVGGSRDAEPKLERPVLEPACCSAGAPQLTAGPDCGCTG